MTQPRNRVGIRRLPNPPLPAPEPLIAVKPYRSAFGDDVPAPRPVRKLDHVATLEAQLKSERRSRDQIQQLLVTRIESLEFQNKELLTAFIAQAARNLVSGQQ